MNTLEQIPHIATEAAQFLVSLEATSLQRGPGAKAFAETLAQIKSAWDEKEQALQKMEHVSLTDFQTFRNDKLDRTIGFAVQSLVTACASLQAVAAEAIFPLNNSPTRSQNTNAAMTTLAAFESRGAEHNNLLGALDAAKSSAALRKARHNIATGNWLNALENVCESAQLTQQMVAALRSAEPSPSHDPRQNRFLSGENFLYVKALARQLLMAGTAPRDVEKLAAALYEYGHKNDAPCAELIDEEILALNPNIRRESLAKSRLEVRLSDKNFPLSARHKEWVVQTTRAFLKE